MKEEEAEEEFSKRNKVMSRFSTMVRKRINDEKEDEDNDDDDEGGGKKTGKDKGGKCSFASLSFLSSWNYRQSTLHLLTLLVKKNARK